MSNIQDPIQQLFNKHRIVFWFDLEKSTQSECISYCRLNGFSLQPFANVSALHFSLYLLILFGIMLLTNFTSNNLYDF